MGGGWKAVWNFSENSSNLAQPSLPKRRRDWCYSQKSKVPLFLVSNPAVSSSLSLVACPPSQAVLIF